MGELREGFRFVIAGLHDAGALSPGWTADQAADWAWGRAHLSAWRHMVIERGWSPQEYADRCVRSILDELVAERRSSGVVRSSSRRTSTISPQLLTGRNRG